MAARRYLDPWFIRRRIAVNLATQWRAIRRRVVLAFTSGKPALIERAEAAWRRGDGVAAERYWGELSEAEPRSPQWPSKISTSARQRGEFAAAERVLLDARERGAASEDVESEIIRLGRLCRKSNAAVEDAVAIVAEPNAPAERIFYASLYLLARNALQAARAGFARVPDQGRTGELARCHLAGIDILDAAAARGRTPVSGWLSPAENSVLVRETGSDTLVVAFTPSAGMFGVPVNVLHAMLADAGVNALYLFDSRMLGHLGGSDRFGRGYPAMLEGVRRLAGELGTRRLISIGGSLAGYTAILAGLNLGADGVLAFSPMTRTNFAFNPENTPSPLLFARMQAEVPEMLTDLRPALESRRSCDRIEIYYGGANPRDRLNVGHVASVRGVILREVSGLKHHDCASELARRGKANLLEPFLRMP